MALAGELKLTLVCILASSLAVGPIKIPLESSRAANLPVFRVVVAPSLLVGFAWYFNANMAWLDNRARMSSAVA